MCGIVGHLGTSNSIDRVLEGLRRLEYRGYDSAGICFKDESGDLKLYKKEGKLANLRGLLEGKTYTAHACIGHTRWATHGEVNDTNSHPHLSGDIAIVHNGIIENAFEIKKDLQAKGFEFKSQTDTEVFLALLVEETKKGVELLQAVANSFKKVHGNSAFVVLNKKTNELIAVKRGAPLIAGTHESSFDVLFASDPYAIIGAADMIFFPQDEVIVVASATKEHLLKFYELDLTVSTRYTSKKQEMTLDATEKGNYEHFMLKEIHEQPELLRMLVAYYFKGEGKDRLKKFEGKAPKRIHITACGTAWHAGLVIKNFLENENRIPVNVELASEFRYRNPIVFKEELGLFISQSGETADTLAAQALCKESGMQTYSIVNVEGSTLFRDCDENLLIRAGMEIGVASTKAFTQQAITGKILAQSFKGFDDVGLPTKINLLADRIQEILDRSNEIKKVAEALYDKKGYIFTGRGVYFPIALEGALKLKEIAYVHAEGYAAGELKHGPIALIDNEMVNVAVVGPELYEKTVSNIQEVKARRGIILTVGPDKDEELRNMSDYYIGLNFAGLGDLSPVYANVVLQLLSYYMAKFKGTDIDKPRNLAKSVTVE